MGNCGMLPVDCCLLPVDCCLLPTNDLDDGSEKVSSQAAPHPTQRTVRRKGTPQQWGSRESPTFITLLA
jgi:hypothetical protein